MRCRTRGLMGPVILITIGVLFFIGQYNWHYSFERLWPVILIVIGVVKVFSETASTEGHVDRSGWQTPPSGSPPPPPNVPPPPPPPRPL
ncbi:MAG: LiaI-LiaF-like domain-containing protein [Candidatus Acidiferrales bacterium]